MSALRSIDPKTAAEWLGDERAVLIDVREPDEYVREHIPGSRLVPLSGFDAADFPREHDKIGVFHCASGGRTLAIAPKILGTGFREVRLLEGGLDGWKGAGLPVAGNRRAPLPIMRQVQIIAGTLVLLGVLLAVVLSPWFLAISAFVGVGLVVAGVTGFCGMARLLRALPWNRIATPSGPGQPRPA